VRTVCACGLFMDPNKARVYLVCALPSVLSPERVAPSQEATEDAAVVRVRGVWKAHREGTPPRPGDTTPASVNAISNASGKILSSIKLELDVLKMLGKKPTSIAGFIDAAADELKP
jgi:hypothetical protein